MAVERCRDEAYAVLFSGNDRLSRFFVIEVGGSSCSMDC